jgi:SHAQKYF class myb-like DNA-binding protein
VTLSYVVPGTRNTLHTHVRYLDDNVYSNKTEAPNYASSSRQYNPSSMNRSSHAEDAGNNFGITNQRKRGPAPTRLLDHERMAKRSSDSSTSETTRTGESSWTEQVHRQFVGAIMELGLKQASTSVIINNMSLQHAALSGERVKSRLQKYRRNRDKSKSEFMRDYDSWMQTALPMGATTKASPLTITGMMGSDGHPHLLGGHAAAFLSFVALVEEYSTTQPVIMQLPPDISRQNFVGAKVPYPAMTPQERRSPLGVSIMRVIALCSSMPQYILQQREAAQQEVATGLESTSLEGEHTDAAMARSTSTDPSMVSSALEPIGIQANELQGLLSNLEVPSSILPLGDATKPNHHYERKMSADNNEAIDPFESIMHSDNDDQELHDQFHSAQEDEDSPELGQCFPQSHRQWTGTIVAFKDVVSRLLDHLLVSNPGLLYVVRRLQAGPAVRIASAMGRSDKRA